MEAKLQEMKRRLMEAYDLRCYAGALLDWDQTTYMPPAARRPAPGSLPSSPASPRKSSPIPRLVAFWTS